MTLGAAIAFLTKLVELGATPAVQDFAKAFLARILGVPQNVLDAAIAASEDAAAPKVDDRPTAELPKGGTK